MKAHYPIILATMAAIMGCQSNTKNGKVEKEQTQDAGTFGYDLAFLKKYKEAVVLSAPDNANAQAIVIPDYQGRVMTSTANGDGGNSYGWINYALIESGRYQPHMNGFGGEERFWLSPEGGQFSVYFKKGKPFDFENWQTPALIDTVSYPVVESDAASVQFQVTATIENYSGKTFTIEINRKVEMLTRQSIAKLLDLPALDGVKAVAYRSTNSATNKAETWKPETGMLGIWLLGMFRPSDQTTIIAPFSKGQSEKPLITDDYFGKIPTDRLAIKDSTLFLKADGKHRSKLGIAPKSARNVAGSYDAEKGILTIIQFDLDPQGQYMKSTWELHKDPYKGDALNAYNDGKLADGTQMGPFYELESNSSVKALEEGEAITHRQSTFHFEGDKAALGEIARKVLGVEIEGLGVIFE
ncbi:DUF6786 family protein [Dyadobacter fermentans]|uniref:Lipoprotein n=1 Tax=Dyadobacter fermentans (strain ATCC 700827 / DSM 18053 / CIP 107007 / KCTC 52180 / NS114) TaxID=471854 RepID=C6W321_DYAFD|nr:DUF6786 family protein [Dyadobacter fermentans]ACT95734.1 conserved hypothetical protein [Dyadobacter fermentans DSM 18053]